MKVKKSIHMLPAAVPIVCAWTSLFRYPAFLIPLSIVLLFLALLLPCADRRENLWMFVFSIPTLIPLTLRILYLMRDVLLDSNGFVNALLCIFAFLVLMSAEELILQYVTRLIWKKQYPW